MSKHTIKRDYTLTTEMYDLEDYANLMDMTAEEMLEYEHGMCVGCINAVLRDETTGYSMRITRSLYATHFLAVAEATSAATLALLDDYFEYLRGNGLA